MKESHHSTISEVIAQQRRRLASDDVRERMLESFFHSGDVCSRLRGLTDRQIGQLMFDHVWDEIPLVSPARSIFTEANERLFRSPAGTRSEGESFNDPSHLPDCPICGEHMMHFIGFDEPDYRECVSMKCGHKIAEGQQ